ncbi:MAG: hypothetical protein KAR39_09255 [Thermoplasmata archaeon]|nr:hypothetical protein [Thermoplasmata archaeon]
MVSSNGQYLKAFDDALEQWTDERFISRTQVRAVSVFSVYLVNLSEEDGWDYVGHSYKVGTPMGCLVVKADIGGVPHVVFTSGRTYTGCVVAFLRKLEEGWLEWRRDRYRV